MNGWFRIERKLFEDHPFFGREPMSEREAWIWMIHRAAWEDTRHRVGAMILDVPRGSFMATLREMQSAFMWRSDAKVRGFLKRLEAEGMIERTTVGTANAPKTHVSICNYNKYQASERTENAPKTHGERTENAVKKELNNKQTEANASVARKRAARLPADWALPMEWGQWALSQGWPEAVIREEAEKFRDYWIAQSGKSAAKLDWLATWRNWMRNSKAPRAANVTPFTGGHHARTDNRRREEDAVREYVRRRAAGQIDLGPDPSDPFAGR